MKNCILLEETEKGILFPVGSILDINGEPVFWRDFDIQRFLFRKGDYTAIYQDDIVIRYLTTTKVKDMYFRDYKYEKIFKTSLEAYKTTRIVNMAGRKQRGLNLMRFREVENLKKPENTKGSERVIINDFVVN